MTPEQYMTERVDDQIQWLSGQAAWNQVWFKRLRTLELVLATSVPVLAAYADLPWVKLLIGLIGAVLAVAGILSLYKFQESWIEYRATCEGLKREKLLYQTSSGDYAGGQSFPAFVTRVEALLGAETARWMQQTGARTAARDGDPAGAGP